MRPLTRLIRALLRALLRALKRALGALERALERALRALECALRFISYLIYICNIVFVYYTIRYAYDYTKIHLKRID